MNSYMNAKIIQAHISKFSCPLFGDGKGTKHRQQQAKQHKTIFPNKMTNPKKTTTPQTKNQKPGKPN